MNSKVSNIARNTSYFTIALIFQKIISFSYFTIIARALGPDDLGKYYFAISFTSIFSILIDIGLANIITREVAKTENTQEARKNNINKLMGSVMAIKITTAIITLLITVFAAIILGYSQLIKNLIYLSCICMILDSFTLTFFSIIRGFHNLLYESIASVIFQIIVFATGLFILKMNLGLVWLMFALVAASTFYFLYSAILVIYKYQISLKFIINKDLISALVYLAMPFALFAIFQRLYTYFDSVLLTTIAGPVYNGYYQIAFKIINALQFLPLAFTATIYPAFSTYWFKNREQISITFTRAINYLIIISLPIIVGTIFLADKIILIFKSQFNDAILPLQISMIALIFIFINYPIGSLLNACDRQKDNTRNILIVLIFSVILNMILIPLFKVVGASITVVLTNMLMFILGMYYVPKIINYKPKDNIIFFIKTIISALVMGIATYFLKNYLNILAVVAISGFVYFIMILLLGAVRREDVISILRSFAKKGDANLDVEIN